MKSIILTIIVSIFFTTNSIGQNVGDSPQTKLGFTIKFNSKVLNDSQIDTTTPNGKLIFTIFSTLAEYERELIRERTKAGLEAARARGRNGGRPKGLSKKAKNKAIAAAALYTQGQTVDSILKAVEIGSKTTRHKNKAGVSNNITYKQKILTN